MNFKRDNIGKTSNKHSYLTFNLGNETFAASVEKVLNILEMTPITKVPKSPVYMKGVINLRGNVLPVIDLRIKFGMPASEITVDSCIVVLNTEIDNELIVLGILVDGVSEVLEIEDDKIEPSPTIGTKYKPEFLKGIWKRENGFVMILNIDLIFSTNEFIYYENSNETELEKTEVK